MEIVKSRCAKSQTIKPHPSLWCVSGCVIGRGTVCGFGRVAGTLNCFPSSSPLPPRRDTPASPPQTLDSFSAASVPCPRPPRRSRAPYSPVGDAPLLKAFLKTSNLRSSHLFQQGSAPVGFLLLRTTACLSSLRSCCLYL